MTGTGAVVGHVSQRTAAHGLDRTGTLDRRQIDNEQTVIETGTQPGELEDQPFDQTGQSTAALRSHQQETISGAKHRYQQQVEVGEHHSPPGSVAQISTTDFDPLRYVPSNTTHTPPTAEPLI